MNDNPALRGASDMYTVDKLKERNRELADDITELLNAYVASTGIEPEISIQWMTYIGSAPLPRVYVTAVIR